MNPNNGIHIIGQSTTIIVSELVEAAPGQWPYSKAIVKRGNKVMLEVNMPIDDPRTGQVASPANAKELIVRFLHQTTHNMVRLLKPQTGKEAAREMMAMVEQVRTAKVEYVPVTEEQKQAIAQMKERARVDAEAEIAKMEQAAKSMAGPETNADAQPQS